jgi:hypothetical protein
VVVEEVDRLELVLDRLVLVLELGRLVLALAFESRISK